jgi:phosphonate transport system ATP-binding protein
MQVFTYYNGNRVGHMSSNAIMQLKNVCKSYGNTRALQPVNMEIIRGEKVALIGPSGAGKSTLLGIMSGAVGPDSGTYRLNTHDFISMNRKQRSQNVGIIRQQYDLVEPLKVVHNVLAGRLGTWGLGKSLLSLMLPQDIESARKALSLVGIENKLHEKTSVLSGGEQQRVALARLLIQNPNVILADEPVASLDPARAEQILNILVDMTNDGRQTLIASLHSVELAQKYFTRIIGLRDGKILMDKPARELVADDFDTLYNLEMTHYE